MLDKGRKGQISQDHLLMVSAGTVVATVSLALWEGFEVVIANDALQLVAHVLECIY